MEKQVGRSTIISRLPTVNELSWNR